jgi:A/G-specific adenine glycosylase
VIFPKIEFRRALLNWYRRHGRDLPWRQTNDPYAILVSEFMLQQTQVATVLPYYNKWLRRFPDFSTLARASENDVLHAWQGLGYYARARNLHATAKLIAACHRGCFPRDLARMQRLPGVGRYIAHAVASFAFDQSVPIVEANTARVLARIFNLRLPIDRTAGRDALWNYATSLVPSNAAHNYNSALIDLGALVCLPRPECTICPVKQFCRASKPETLPHKRERPGMQHLVENHAFICKRNRILLQQADRRWRGMWILPPLKLNGFKPSIFRRPPVYEAAFPFTHHRVTLNVFGQRKCKLDARGKDFAITRWFAFADLASIPIPSPHRRAIVDLVRAREG